MIAMNIQETHKEMQILSPYIYVDDYLNLINLEELYLEFAAGQITY